jgi:hypothetical protein
LTHRRSIIAHNCLRGIVPLLEHTTVNSRTLNFGRTTVPGSCFNFSGILNGYEKYLSGAAPHVWDLRLFPKNPR